MRIRVLTVTHVLHRVATLAAALLVLTLVLVLGLSTFSAAQIAGTTPNSTVPSTSPTAPNLRILSPQNGQKLGVNFVNVQYQITNPSAAASGLPTFQLRLDSGDVIQTASETYTFTGLRPGQHVITVELVDANGSPVVGARAEVRFLVAPTQNPPAASPSSSSNSSSGPSILTASVQQSAPARVDTDGQHPSANTANDPNTPNSNKPLPQTSSALPLLSVIGFGVLVGGIASAMKTR